MKNEVVGSALFGVAMLCVGCFAHNASNPTGAPTVPMTFASDSTQDTEFTEWYEWDCSRPNEKHNVGILAFVNAITPGKKDLKVPTGKEIRIAVLRGVRVGVSGGSTGYGQVITNEWKYCVNHVSFAPEAGHRYEHRQQGCNGTVVDSATGKEPTTFKRLPPSCVDGGEIEPRMR
jgi:hypothetical protein